MAKPMVLTKDNVIATMEGRKTMTRRIINDSCLQSIKFDEISPVMNTPPHQHDSYEGKWYYELQSKVDDTDHFEIKPRYQVGDEVYVAEGYQIQKANYKTHRKTGIYLTDEKQFDVTLSDREFDLWMARKIPFGKTPGRFMYKSLARTFMKITEVRVERLQEINEEDAKAEGCEKEFETSVAEFIRGSGVLEVTYKLGFKRLRNSIYGNGAWDLNLWFFVYSWELIRR